MGTDKLAFAEDRWGSDHWACLTGSDVSHVTGKGPTRKRSCSKVCSAHAQPELAQYLFPIFFHIFNIISQFSSVFSISFHYSNRQSSNKHSEPTTICSCKTDKKCTAKIHGQNEYSEPTTICTCKTDNFLINIRNQQLYVLAKQTINALLKLMVKMNTRNWKKGRLNSEKIWKM